MKNDSLQNYFHLDWDNSNAATPIMNYWYYQLNNYVFLDYFNILMLKIIFLKNII
jgi:hypothetical protein